MFHGDTPREDTWKWAISSFLPRAEMPRSEQLLVVPSAYRVANQQRMADRRALEWIGASKPGWFLDMNIILVADDTKCF